MFQLSAVTKSFGGHVVLHPTTLSFEPGLCTVLIGPSGCGKSTLLRLLIGLLRPDAGQVTFDGVELAPENVMMLRRRMGYVIQDGGLFPHLSARENTALMARYLGWDAQRVSARVEQLAELTRMPRELLGRYPVQLSGGQRQRVGIMRALMLDPDVILLDEPMAALDPLVRYELQQDLRTIFQTLHKTVVLITHDMSEAGYFGDHVLLMHHGRIVQQGQLKDLLRAPADEFVARFLTAQRALHAEELQP